MAETVEFINVRVIITARITGSDGSRMVCDINREIGLAEGTGSYQAGQAWWDESRALATTSEDLDLNGTLTAFNGDSVVLNNVKILLIEDLDTDTGDHLFLKQGSANPVTTILGGTTPTLKIGPGGFILLVNPIDGYAVTAASADKIAIESVDNSTYQILIVGDNA